MSTFFGSCVTHRCTMLHVLTLGRTKHSEMRTSQWATKICSSIRAAHFQEGRALKQSVLFYFHQCTSSRFPKMLGGMARIPITKKNNYKSPTINTSRPRRNPSIRQNHDPLGRPVTDIFFSPWCSCSSSTVRLHVSSPAPDPVVGWKQHLCWGFRNPTLKTYTKTQDESSIFIRTLSSHSIGMRRSM